MTAIRFSVCTALLAAALAAAPGAHAREVKIADYLPEMRFTANGRSYVIDRIQNENHELTGSFAKTSRKCPPFCIHPMEAMPGVTTVGELELLEFLKNRVEKGTGLLIDSRVESFFVKGTIPGAINIPFTVLNGDDRDPNFREAMARLGVMRGESVNWSDSAHRSTDALGEPNRRLTWDYSRAKDILLFCNGPWCDQSPRAIRALVKAGYPVNRIFYYRGGMQDWLMLGLSVEVPTPIGGTPAPAAAAR